MGHIIIFRGLLYAFKLVILIMVLITTINRNGMTRTIKALLKASFIYWIPSVFSVFMQGRDVIDNASSVYFIGNKFVIAYLSILMYCFCLVLNVSKPESFKTNYKCIVTNLFFLCLLCFICERIRGYS